MASSNNGVSAVLRFGTALGFESNFNLEEKSVPFTLPPLPYSFDALEPDRKSVV
jgi:hypothetical protein